MYGKKHIVKQKKNYDIAFFFYKQDKYNHLWSKFKFNNL